MASTTFASKSKETPNQHSKFGCSYTDNNYKLDTKKWNGQYPNDPQYSDPIKQRKSFNSQKEFNKFYEAVDKTMKAEMKKKLYNSVDPFLEMIEKYNKSGLEFSKFYQEFVPTFPPPGKGGDSTTALLSVYEKLSKKYPGLDESFVMGSLDQDVGSCNNTIVEACANRENNAVPPPKFQHEKLVGIIRFKVANETGVILLDMESYYTPTPIVMKNSMHMLNTKSAQTYNMFLQMYNTQFTYFKDYIIISNTYEKKGNKGDKKEDLLMEDILYISRSLCSFVESTQKTLLLDLAPSLSKYSSSDKPSINAFAIFYLHKCVFRLSVNNNKKVDRRFFFNQIDNKLKQDEKDIRKVATALGNTYDDFNKKLIKFADICGKKSEMLKSMVQLYYSIDKSSLQLFYEKSQAIQTDDD